MAVAEIHELHEGRTGGADDTGLIRYAKLWTIRTTDRKDGPQEVSSATGLPRKGQWYWDAQGYLNIFVRCRSLQIDPDMAKTPRGYWWKARAEFSNERFLQALQAELGKGGPNGRTGGGVESFKNGSGNTGSYEPGNRPPDPADWPCTVRWSTSKIQLPMYRADMVSEAGFLQMSDVTPQTSANEPYDPPPTYSYPIQVLTVTKHQINFDHALIGEMVGALNNDVWMSRSPCTWMVDDIDAAEVWENGFGRWRVTYRLLYSRRGWQFRLLDAGYHYLDSSGNRQPILQKSGLSLTRPKLLDLNGQVLPDGMTPKWRLYVPKDSMKDFGQLGLI